MPGDAEAACARAQQAFDAGRFFEAHEHWEDAWRSLPPGPARTRVHGLLHLAVALYQHERGQAAGAASQLRKACAKLVDDPSLQALCHRVKGVIDGAQLRTLWPQHDEPAPSPHPSAPPAPKQGNGADSK